MSNDKDLSFPIPEFTVRQLVVATLIVALVGLGFWLLFRFYQVVLVLIAALIISTALRPVVTRLQRFKIPPPVTIIVIYALVLVLLAAFLRFGAPLIAEQVTTIGNSLTEGYASLRQSVTNTPSLLLNRLAASLPEELPLAMGETPAAEAPPPVDEAVEPAEPVLPQEPVVAELTDTTAITPRRILFSLLAAVAIFMLVIHWTIEGERVKRSFYLFFPPSRRDAVRDFVATAEERIIAYVSGQLIVSLILGVLSFIAYLLIGLPSALLLGVFAGVMGAVPLVGAVIGAIPALIIAFSISPLSALWVVIATALIQQIEGNFLTPRIMKQALGVRPLVTLLAVIAFGTLFGVIGAVVALPLAAVLQLLIERSVLNAELERERTPDRGRATVLRYETQELVKDVRNLIRTKSDVAEATMDQVEDSIEAIALDLDSLLVQYAQEKE